jgi:drug/metabolite transporter (DMT)-like permease
VLVLGLFCTALALPLFYALVKEVGASRSAVINYVTPAVAVLLGALVLHEVLTLATGAGFLLIIGGSWLATGGALPVAPARRREHPAIFGTTPLLVTHTQDRAHQARESE